MTRTNGFISDTPRTKIQLCYGRSTAPN